MNKVVLIPSNTDLNRGDQALVWESVNLINDCYDHSVECVLMADTTSVESEIQNRQTKNLGYKFIDIILKHPGRRFHDKKKDSKAYSKLTMIQWGYQAIVDYLRTRPLLSNVWIIRKFGELLLSKKSKETLCEIKESDAIFVKGGGFIHSYGSITDPYFIYWLTFHIRLALAYKKKVFILPNSVGPLNNSIAKSIAVKTLRRCTLVTVRENISKTFLDEMGVISHIYPDLGFFLQPSEDNMEEYLINKGVILEQKKVVMTLRPYRFQGFENPTELFGNYIDGFTNLVTHLINKGYHVTFMAHTLGPSSHEDDRIAIQDVIASLPKCAKNKISYIEDFNLTCKDVEKIYSYYDYMIGTRFHSVIFSLNVGVPSIAIAYGGNKGKGIMNVLGNDDFSLDMDKICNENLITNFDKLESSRDSYLSNISKKRGVIDMQKQKLIEEIKKQLVNHQFRVLLSAPVLIPLFLN